MNTFTEFNYCATDYDDWKPNRRATAKCKLELITGDIVTLPKECSEYHKIDECRDSSQLGMSIHDYNLSMAIMSNMMGFTLIFLIGLLFLLQGKK